MQEIIMQEGMHESVEEVYSFLFLAKDDRKSETIYNLKGFGN